MRESNGRRAGEREGRGKMTKICSKCKEEKDIDEFRLSTRDRHYAWCIKCFSVHNKKYRHTHKEEIAKQRAQYYQENKEEITEYFAQYRQELLNQMMHTALCDQYAIHKTRSFPMSSQVEISTQNDS